MESTDAQLLERIDAYIEDLYTPPGDFSVALKQCLEDTKAAGLPDIQVSPNQGKLLYLMAKLARASRILEIGTLGGYSSLWLGHALPPDGKLLSLEINAAYAEVARNSIHRGGFANQVEVRVAPANQSLRELIAEHTQPFDLIFLDADKNSYPEYLNLSLELSHPGTLILADNVIRGGRVLEPAPTDPLDAGAKAYNEAIARHPRLESLILPILRYRVDGIAVSIVK